MSTESTESTVFRFESPMGRCSCAHFVAVEADLPVVFLELMNLQCAELHLHRRSTFPSKITMLQCSVCICMQPLWIWCFAVSFLGPNFGPRIIWMLVTYDSTRKLSDSHHEQLKLNLGLWGFAQLKGDPSRWSPAAAQVPWFHTGSGQSPDTYALKSDGAGWLTSTSAKKTCTISMKNYQSAFQFSAQKLRSLRSDLMRLSEASPKSCSWWSGAPRARAMTHGNSKADPVDPA
jgi:hypothetical protein